MVECYHVFQKYQVRIRDVKQPLLLSKPKKKDLLRGAGDVYLITELCIMTGLTEEMRSNFNMMKDLAEYLRTAPDKRVHSIMTLNKDVIANEKVSFWNIAVRRKMWHAASIPARFCDITWMVWGSNDEETVDYIALVMHGLGTLTEVI